MNSKFWTRTGVILIVVILLKIAYSYERPGLNLAESVEEDNAVISEFAEPEIRSAQLVAKVESDEVNSPQKSQGEYSSFSQEEERTIAIYEQLNKAVVFITTTSLTVDPFDIFLDYRPEKGTGSGVIIDRIQGLILTNLHVIKGGSKIEVSLEDGNSYEAVVAGIDPRNDIALIRLKENVADLTEIKFGRSENLRVGQRVLAIGNPFGLHRTLTTGIISSLERAVRGGDGAVLTGLIQTDAAINPGNSGGPLIDMTGKLIGINTAILSNSGDNAGIGFAMPIDKIIRLLPEMLKYGKVREPFVGIQVIDTNWGPMIMRILPDSPASKSILKPIERQVNRGFIRGYIRDIKHAHVIKAVNGQPIKSKEDYLNILATHPKEIRLEVLALGHDDVEQVVLTPELK